MFDLHLLKAAKKPLHWAADKLIARKVHADTITLTGLAFGLIAALLICFKFYLTALALIGLNRLCDGLDGIVARQQGGTDRGAFLDVVADFLFYSAIPLGFAFADSEANALAAAFLIYSFIGTGTTFLAFAILAAKRDLKSEIYQTKGFYYMSGLTEAGETLLVFALMCLFPAYFPLLATIFGGLCLLTTLMRLVGGAKTLRENQNG